MINQILKGEEILGAKILNIWRREKLVLAEQLMLQFSENYTELDQAVLLKLKNLEEDSDEPNSE